MSQTQVIQLLMEVFVSVFLNLSPVTQCITVGRSVYMYVIHKWTSHVHVQCTCIYPCCHGMGLRVVENNHLTPTYTCNPIPNALM